MSSPSVNALSAGVQQLYNDGLLPSNLNTSVLNSASAGQLNQLANTSVSLNEVSVLFGNGSSTSDSAALSSTASNALLQEINPSSTTSSSSTDPLTQAVDNELTSNLDTAVNKFLPQTTSTGSTVNVLG